MVRIALVAKYIREESAIFTDAYASVIKALMHAAMFAKRRMEIEVRVVVMECNILP